MSYGSVADVIQVRAFAGDVPGGVLKLGQQVRELHPVGAQPARDQTDPGAPTDLQIKQVVGRTAIGVSHEDLYPWSGTSASRSQTQPFVASGGVDAIGIHPSLEDLTCSLP